MIVRPSLDQPLGMHLVTRPTDHVDGTVMNVKAVLPGGAAAACVDGTNRIEVGDRVLRINDRDLVMVPETECMVCWSRWLVAVVGPAWWCGGWACAVVGCALRCRHACAWMSSGCVGRGGWTCMVVR